MVHRPIFFSGSINHWLITSRDTWENAPYLTNYSKTPDEKPHVLKERCEAELGKQSLGNLTSLFGWPTLFITDDTYGPCSAQDIVKKNSATSSTHCALRDHSRSNIVQPFVAGEWTLWAELLIVLVTFFFCLFTAWLLSFTWVFFVDYRPRFPTWRSNPSTFSSLLGDSCLRLWLRGVDFDFVGQSSDSLL